MQSQQSEIEPTNSPTSQQHVSGKTSLPDLGPGKAFEDYLQNEIIIERLKFLNYEKEFVKQSDSFKIIPRYI